MPTYEYLCSSCGTRFDKFQNINDDPINECPDCGKSVKRLISGGSGFIMKGGNNFEMPSCAQGEPCCASGSCAMANHCH